MNTYIIRSKNIQTFINTHNALCISEADFHRLSKRYKAIKFVDVSTRETWLASLKDFGEYGTVEDKGWGRQRWLAIEFFDWRWKSNVPKRFEKA